MSKEQKYEAAYEGPYTQIGWDLGLESTLRWQKGPQFGSRTVSYPHVIDLEGKRHNLQPQRGPWTWYNWRFRRVEGEEERFPPALTFRSNQEKTTAGIELEGKPDATTQKINPS